MPGLLFSNGALLVGMAALAIPILIHLLLKRRKKRMLFSTIQFFLQQDRQSVRRKLHNLLLLAARLLLIALLVLAFARPYLPASFGGTQAPGKQIVFVLDTSASMMALGSDGPRWKEAVQTLRDQLQKIGPQDRAALVRCSTQTETVAPLAPPDQVKAMVETLKPDCGVADLSEGLRMAVNLLRTAPQSQATICLISDFQRSNCQKLSAVPVPWKINLQLLPLREADRANLAVSDLAIAPSGSPGGCRIRASNFSEQEARATKCDLIIDNQTVASETVDLAAGATSDLSPKLPALSPGWHVVAARLPAEDALALDNTRYQAVFVPPPVRILCVEPRASKLAFENETFFVTSALEPGTNGSFGLGVDRVPPAALAQQLTVPQSRYRVVVLPALARIPQGYSKVLTEFVQQGGAALFFLGEEANARLYNSEFRELLPATLTRVQGDLDQPDQFCHISDFDKTAEVFAPFRQPDSGDLSLPEFRRRFGLIPGNSCQILARLTDGAPLLIARTLGRGRVALVNTSIGTSWTDWPKRKTFVPWIHGLVRWLSNSHDQKMQAPPDFTTADVADVNLGSDSAGFQFHLRAPSGTEVPTGADAKGRLKADLPEPGIYSLRDSHGQEVQRFAANVPVQESDLLTLSAREFEQRIVRNEAASETKAALFDAGSGERPLWRVFLLAALTLLFLEALLANRTFA